MKFSDAAGQLVEISHDFYRRGWVLGTSGNFSAVVDEQPLSLAITASSLDKGRITADQIVQVGQDGRAIRGTGRPSAETLLHLAVARAHRAGAVLHTHSVYSTCLSDLYSSKGRFFIEGYEMLKGLAGVSTHEHREWIPILGNSQDLEKLSGQAEDLLLCNPELHGFLVHRHGMYTWGKDLAEARRHVEILEFLFQTMVLSLSLREVCTTLDVRDQSPLPPGEGGTP
jgi:methylthioribulose-1-phosphate dehydratase